MSFKGLYVAYTVLVAVIESSNAHPRGQLIEESLPVQFTILVSRNALRVRGMLCGHSPGRAVLKGSVLDVKFFLLRLKLFYFAMESINLVLYLYNFILVP